MSQREKYSLELVEEEGKPAHWQMVVKGEPIEVIEWELVHRFAGDRQWYYLVPMCAANMEISDGVKSGKLVLTDTTGEVIVGVGPWGSVETIEGIRQVIRRFGVDEGRELELTV